jgi:hypothetical protein
MPIMATNINGLESNILVNSIESPTRKQLNEKRIAAMYVEVI